MRMPQEVSEYRQICSQINSRYKEGSENATHSPSIFRSIIGQYVEKDNLRFIGNQYRWRKDQQSLSCKQC